MSSEPSDWLPSLSRTVAPAHVADALERLERCVAAGELARGDFERTFVQRWLSSVVTLAVRRSADEPAFDGILARASGLTASLAGRSASGASTQRYKLGSIELDIASGTLRDDSVGSLTWRSAEVLGRRIVEAPEHFMPIGSRRIIELGCGTGLVGLAAAAILRATGRDEARVVLTDFDPLALDQARINAQANGLNVDVERLDWREPVGSNRYDVALGADLTYDMVEPLVSVLANLLVPGGSFHLVTPLRPTHHAMSDAVVSAFGAAPWRIVRNEIEEGPSDVEGAEGQFRYLHVVRASL